jgi:MFS family permease
MAVMAPFNVLVPNFARHELGLSEQGRGMLVGSVATGVLAGGVLARRLRRWRFRGPLIAGTVALAGTMLGVLAFVHSTLSAFPSLVVFGAAGSIAWSLGLASLRSETDIRYAGRVMALYAAVQPLFIAIGSIVFGSLASAFSNAVALSAAAAGAVTSALLILLIPAVRDMGPECDAAASSASSAPAPQPEERQGGGYPAGPYSLRDLAGHR